jgi:hypothetical protein
MKRYVDSRAELPLGWTELEKIGLQYLFYGSGRCPSMGWPTTTTKRLCSDGRWSDFSNGYLVTFSTVAPQ